MKKPEFIIDDLNCGAYDDCLKLMYGVDGSELEFYRNRFINAVNEFCRIFGSEREIELFSAPGRTELGGNHTDHQLGNVLAAAVNLDVIAVAAIREDTIVNVQSEGFDLDTVDISDNEPKLSEINRASGLIRGVSAGFERLGFNVKGYDAYTTSNVLKGSGLSSSAAFEVLLGNICNDFYADGAVSAIKIAEIGQFAENIYFGKPCGLMDQMASSIGNIVSIDFADKSAPKVKSIDFNFSSSGYKLCIIDSGADHADLTDEYAAIPAEMKSVAEFMGKSVLSQVDYEMFKSKIGDIRKACGDRAALRAMHYFSDDRRAVSEAEALKNGDIVSFLKLISESGCSSFMYLQNVYTRKNPREQAVALAIAVADELIGGKGAVRVHGGGFAGTIQAFVPCDMTDEFKLRIKSILGENSCHLLNIRQIGGLKLKVR